jgi:hypothetical protein
LTQWQAVTNAVNRPKGDKMTEFGRHIAGSNGAILADATKNHLFCAARQKVERSLLIKRHHMKTSEQGAPSRERP